MITINKSETADSRTCDYSKVTKEDLLQSSISHIKDVKQGLEFFADMLRKAAEDHDYTKIVYIDDFHKDFISGFKPSNPWYQMHIETERHHIGSEKGIRDDMNLIDVIEHIVDGFMAAMARKGYYEPSELPCDLLQKAAANTVNILMKVVKVNRETA